MGTPDFAVPALRSIHAAGHTIAAVYTKVDSPQGRGRELAQPPVKQAALALGLEVKQPKSLRSSEVIAELKALAPDVIVVAAYAQILPRAVLEMPTYGCKNIHASLLPKYRGGAPIHWAIVNGEEQTGITIMQMAQGIDTGDMILKESIPIGINDTCGELFERLANLGAELILRVLSLPDMGESLREKQNHEEASYARNVTKEDGLLSFANRALEIHNKVRGFNPWPGAYTTLDGQYLRILRTKLCNDGVTLSPGAVQLISNRVLVGCADQTLEICTVQPAGKRAMNAADFVRGYVNKMSGAVLFLAT